MEARLVEWAREFVDRVGQLPTHLEAKTKAIEFSKLGPRFKASKGWYEKFMNRHFKSLRRQKAEDYLPGVISRKLGELRARGIKKTRSGRRFIDYQDWRRFRDRPMVGEFSPASEQGPEARFESLMKQGQMDGGREEVAQSVLPELPEQLGAKAKEAQQEESVRSSAEKMSMPDLCLSNLKFSWQDRMFKD